MKYEGVNFRNFWSICPGMPLYKLAMKNSHYHPLNGVILGCHTYIHFQQTNYLLNVTVREKLRCAHKLQTISETFSHIASRFLKVAFAIKFALNWLAAPQCMGEGSFWKLVWRTGWSIRRFFGGGDGGRVGEGTQARVPQNWKRHGFRPLFFWEEPKFTFEKYEPTP